MRQRIFAVFTNSVMLISAGTLDSQCFVGSVSLSGHSIVATARHVAGSQVIAMRRAHTHSCKARREHFICTFTPSDSLPRRALQCQGEFLHTERLVAWATAQAFARTAHARIWRIRQRPATGAHRVLLELTPTA